MVPTNAPRPESCRLSKTSSYELGLCLAASQSRWPSVLVLFLPLPLRLSLSFTGNVRVNTISINQVLSNENLISYNKFVQVQGPWAVSRRWAGLEAGMGKEA